MYLTPPPIRKLQVAPRLKDFLTDSRWYSLNLYLGKNAEDSVGFIYLKVLNSLNFIHCISCKISKKMYRETKIEKKNNFQILPFKG